MLDILEKHNSKFEYAGILFNIILAIQYFILWYAPQPDQAEKIWSLGTLIFFEEIINISGMVMLLNGIPRKFKLLIGIPLLLGVGYVFNMIMTDNTLLILVIFVIINRLRFIFLETNKVLLKQMHRYTICAFVLCIFLMILVGTAQKFNYIPNLGLTTEYISVSGYDRLIQEAHKKGFSGAFIHPEMLMCLGTLYYGTLIFVETGFLFHTKKLLLKPVEVTKNS
ncbi:hypothetical protein OOZ15_14975 [Galbibacter sp. EGI 63066]|uniref:hypothetical protein n=1 Tax=Galbibacter sp. EGI 63066 TaxID=2993559 RepID=UPI0022496586|nr:hypothetical protein [Galbibacter sp. EGI 63066]MCX2681253.1 hypothetical protein [Galbibacter sp. EGI 63066]